MALSQIRDLNAIKLLSLLLENNKYYFQMGLFSICLADQLKELEANMIMPMCTTQNFKHLAFRLGHNFDEIRSLLKVWWAYNLKCCFSHSSPFLMILD